MNRGPALAAAALAALLASSPTLAAQPQPTIPKFGAGVGVSIGNAFSGGALS